VNPKDFFTELKRRNVYKVAVAYAVIAWLLIQVTDTVFPRLNLPDWAVTLVIVLLILGFPVALVLAWAFELTPEGIKRTEDIAPSESITRRTGRKATALIVIAAFFAAALFAWQFYRPNAISVSGVPASPAAITDKSIAVLPFENASGNPETEYLSDGISEALINSLTELPQLRVIARSTAFRYKGRQIDPQTVGKELKVGAVLMGLVRQVEDRLTVQVDLVDATSGSQLWGEEYERKLSTLVSVKQTIAREVTEKLRLRLSGAEKQQLVRRDTSNAEAYQFFLRGRFNWNKRTAAGITEAIEQFQEAISHDPNFALAYAGLADCYLVLEQYTGTPARETIPKARAAAERALQLDETLAEAHTALAACYEAAWQWDEAETAFKRAISLNPNYPTARHWYQNYLRARGRLDEAVAQIRRAQALDPLSSIFAVNLATALMMKGEIDAARQEAERLVELNPNFPIAHDALGKVYIKQGQYAEAVAAFEKDIALDRTSFSLGNLGHAYAVAGRRDQALAVLKELQDRYERREALGQYVACVHAGLGEIDEAFLWLEKDFAARSGMLEYVIMNSLFDSLRGDPRYADLVRRMGL